MLQLIIIVLVLGAVKGAIWLFRRKLMARSVVFPTFEERDFVQKVQDPEGKTLQLVECFATWCGPCRQQVPHMNDLQRRYGDRVYIVAVSQEKPEAVKQLIQDQKIEYNVCVGSQGADMMKSCIVMGIPHAFLFMHKTMVWNGHPSGLDKQLAKYTAILEPSDKKE